MPLQPRAQLENLETDGAGIMFQISQRQDPVSKVWKYLMGPRVHAVACKISATGHALDPRGKHIGWREVAQLGVVGGLGAPSKLGA